MAFVLKKVSTYKWPVEVSVPVDGGKFKKETFTAIFKKMSRSAFNELIDEGDDALVDQIIEGWEGIKDEDGEEVPFCAGTKKELFDDPYVLRALIESYTNSITGAAEKN
jgi:hypothetical protein